MMNKLKTGNYRIYGHIKGRRGGAYFGIAIEPREPVFGGSNLIYAPVYWDYTLEEVQFLCEGLMKEFPQCECHPKLVSEDEDTAN